MAGPSFLLLRRNRPHRGSMPAVLEFTELLEITEGVKLR
nr:MAG TPA_asm: hypothetical protein [Caudoviricetes sp.]